MPDISKRCCKLGYLIFTLTIFFLSQNEQLFSQNENYSSYSQGVLDTYNSAEENDGVLEIFTFSVLNELNSLDEPVFEGDGDPSLYGKTEYGSEFKLENNLGDLFTIEIPSFVIDSLAEDTDGNYYPVVKNGDNYVTSDVTLSSVTDVESNTTTNSYMNNDGVDVTEIISSEGITTIYDNNDDLSVNIFNATSINAATGETIETTSLNYDNASGVNYFEDNSSTGASSFGYFDNRSNQGYDVFSNNDGSAGTNHYNSLGSLYVIDHGDGSYVKNYNQTDEFGNSDFLIETSDSDGNITFEFYDESLTADNRLNFTFSNSSTAADGSLIQVFDREDGVGQIIKTFGTDGVETIDIEYNNSGIEFIQSIDETNNTTTKQYLNPNGVDVNEHIYENGSSTRYFNDNGLDVHLSTSSHTDNASNETVEYSNLNYNISDGVNYYESESSLGYSDFGYFDQSNNTSYNEFINADGSTGRNIHNETESFYEIRNSDGSMRTELRKYADQLNENVNVLENISVDGVVTYEIYTDTLGYENRVELLAETNTTDATGTIVSVFKGTVENNEGVEEIVELRKTTTAEDFSTIEISSGSSSIIFDDPSILVDEDALSGAAEQTISLAEELISEGQEVISQANTTNTISMSGNASAYSDVEALLSEGQETINAADQRVIDGDQTKTEATINNNTILPISLKGLYDTVNGQAITPEMGYVKLNDGTSNNYVNLQTGDVIEFFVKPSKEYLAKHQDGETFYIDRPVPEDEGAETIVVEVPEYDTSTTNQGETVQVAGPGEELVTLPSGEVKVYITTIHVQGPASKFKPDQIVMPVDSTGDYNYEVEPAAAEKFPDEVEVVAIPEEEAEVISEKVKQIKKEKESPKNPEHDDDTPPPLDPGIEAEIKLKTLENFVANGRSRLLSETKKIIQKEFPNMSKKLIDLVINLADANEKFDLIQDPKNFLDNEFSKLSDPQNLNLILSNNLSQKDLTKIYNLIIYKFSADLADLGFETLKNQEINFSLDVKNANQILEQIQLQNDVMAIAPLLGSNGGNQTLSNLLIKPLEIDPNSSEALFQSADSQTVLNRIKGFSNLINSINNGTSLIDTTEGTTVENIPLIEINVGSGESIAEALEAKLAEDKRLNRNFQTRFQSSKLEKFDFEIPQQDASSKPSATLPLLTDAATISEQELQLVAETTEATNNILDATIDRMLTELGSTSINTDSTQLISAANIQEQSDPEASIIREDSVFGNALLSTQKLRQVEDIRAIFQLLGIGS